MLDKRLADMSAAAPHIRRALLPCAIGAYVLSIQLLGPLRGVGISPAHELAPPADAWEVILQFKLARYASMTELHRNSISGIKKCLKDLER